MILKGALLMLPVIASAQMRSTLFESEKSQAPHKKPPLEEEKEQAPLKKVAPLEPRNLPPYYKRDALKGLSESPVVLPKRRTSVLEGGLNLGDVVLARIDESVIAFQGAKAPVRARILKGPASGALLVGEATLEPNSKRILVEFKDLKSRGRAESLKVLGQAMDLKGVLGIEGRLVSGEAKYFAAEVAASAAAGFADASIQRQQNVLGNFVTPPTLEATSKAALGSALSRTADRFAEKVRQAPEYSVLEGPFLIQVLITNPSQREGT